MVLSRGLVISLGVSALGCTLLFLYFRNKISNVEKKVDTIFDLIQNHQQLDQQQYMQQTMQTQVFNDQQETEFKENENERQENNLINVSDDEDDDSSDSEEVSDSDEEDEDEDQPKLSLAKTEDMSLSINDIKKITVQENEKSNIDSQVELEEVTDSLDDISVDEDEDEDEEDNMDTKEITVEKLDEEFDYNKLKVSELKSMAAAKKLEGYKSLKKGPLIELLKSSE
jgi:hypothetical protein